MFPVTSPPLRSNHGTENIVLNRFSALIAATLSPPSFPAPVHYFHPVPAADAPPLAVQLRAALVRKKLPIAWLEAADSHTGVKAALARAAERFLATSPLSRSRLSSMVSPDAPLVSAFAAATSLGVLPVLVFHPVPVFSAELVHFCIALGRRRGPFLPLPVSPVIILLGTADPETAPPLLADQLCFWPPAGVPSPPSTPGSFRRTPEQR